MYLERFLQYHRYKHRQEEQSRTLRVGGAVREKRFTLARQPEDYKQGRTLTLRMLRGNTMQTDEMLGRECCHLIVADLPYGVQHAPKDAKELGTFQGLLDGALPAYYRALKPGGAIALAFNTYTLPRIAMRVVYAGRNIKPFSQAGNARRLPLEELLTVSDVVTLHCPLTAQNAGMIGVNELARMRSTAFLINTSRGKLVDEAALIDALEQGRLAGAALDVFEKEPEITERLKKMDNVVLTPHIGSNTLRTRNRMAEQCADVIRGALAGRKPANLLNPEVWVDPVADL